MLKYISCLPSCIIILCSLSVLNAQNQDSLKKELKIDVEIRPRGEFRSNFFLVPADSISPEFYISQRNRISVLYQTRKVKFYTSLQEIHLWAKQGIFSQIGDINAYELYVEPNITKNLSLRIGRQGLSLDNGRLFSDAPWSQQSRAHEGLRFLYKKNRLTTDLVAMFTRKYNSAFDINYSPVATNRYKELIVHFLKLKLNEKYTLTTINTYELFERNDLTKSKYQRLTNGGRIEYTNKNTYFTISAFYQYGKDAARKNISSYYIQPEISQNTNKIKIRLGAEIMSGDNTSQINVNNHSFVPLYGVAWKFMGNMNFFTKFPADVNNSGLLNPYLFINYKFNSKISAKTDSHLFYSQYSLKDSKGQIASPFLGYENDLLLNYKPYENVDINLGFSYYISTPSTVLLKKIESTQKTPVWSYLMISFKPKIKPIKV